MIFGKIDYINLLPFHVFIKGSSLQNSFKKTIEYKKGVPSELNKKLRLGKIDAAIISSVESAKPFYKKLDLGICAQKRVNSVLVRKNSPTKKDKASATSNALSNILHVKGEVIIGDRALKMYLQSPDEFEDLVTLWHKKTKLPFVFARLCVRKNHNFYERLSKRFLSRKTKIPRYILDRYASTRQIEQKEILSYLKLIHYPLKQKQKKALNIFLKKVRYE